MGRVAVGAVDRDILDVEFDRAARRFARIV